MCSAFRTMVAVVALSALVGGAPPPLRVCSDPNNMPFSNRAGDGFENRIAELIARDLHRPLEYFWSPQRRGFIRTTLDAGRCDLVMAVPERSERVLTTRSYYRSAYAFVSRGGRSRAIRSFDDARLQNLVVGIQVTGDDYNNPPAAQALASRGIVSNVRGYMVYGDYSKPDPQRAIVDAVASGAIDVAVVWGPTAGYFARHQPVPMAVTPVAAGAPATSPFDFAIAMGVRRDDRTLQQTIDGVLVRRRADIRRVLAGFGVPLL